MMNEMIILIGLSALLAILLYCVMEKWFKLELLSACRFCIAFWTCISAAIIRTGVCLAIGVFPDPVAAIFFPFALLGLTATFYFFIKQSFL